MVIKQNFSKPATFSKSNFSFAMRFYRSLRSLQNDSKKARFINRQNILQIFYYAK